MVAALGSKKVCVYVDDSIGAGHAGKIMLERTLGNTWDVLFISDAVEGLNIALTGTCTVNHVAKKVAVMVLDNEMPIITGVEIAEKRRTLEKEKGLERMPLYLHSGNNDKLRDFHHLFDHKVIPKPVTLQLLSNAVKDFPK